MSTVFFDIDTQYDFLLPAGALPVPGAERLIARIARLNRWAAQQGIVVVSTMDAHSENDPEFRVWPGHCIGGTLGQRKPEATLLERRVSVPARAATFDLAGTQQVILEKNALDCFTNPNIGKVLRRLDAERCILYGVVTEYCVRSAVLGLLQTGKPVEVLTDAIQPLDEAAGRATLAEFTARGVKAGTVPGL